MIKLKLKREQLFVLFTITNPVIYESKINSQIQFKDFRGLNILFNIIEIGEMVSKRWLYTNKNKNSINLSYAQGSSLLIQTIMLVPKYDDLSYEYNVLTIISNELHAQLSNYQSKFYGEQQFTFLSAGGNQAIAGAIKNLAGQSV